MRTVQEHLQTRKCVPLMQQFYIIGCIELAQEAQKASFNTCLFLKK